MAFVTYKFKWDTSLNKMFKTNIADFADVEIRSLYTQNRTEVPRS